MKNIQMITAAALVAGLPTNATANDGHDRYRKHAPNVLVLFPDAQPGGGYRVLRKDGPGGADGDMAFRWAQPHAVALVRLAAHETVRRLGPAPFPPAIFDLSAENGDTPIQLTPGRPPRGRHPGGSHDGGLNLDLGYYLTSLKGSSYSPDHSACTNHFVDKKDVWQCQGPADRLDDARQAFFMLQLFKLDARHFNGQLIGEIGIDRQVRAAVFAQLLRWSQHRGHGATPQLLATMRQSLTSDRWEGWARAHHHHIHLRLRDLSLSGALAVGHARLLAAERKMDEVLLARERRKDNLSLRLRLLSFGLQRAVQIELVGYRRKMPPRKVRFQVGGGKWTKPDPADRSGYRAVVDLPRRLRASSHRIAAKAVVTDAGGASRTLQAAITAPRQLPHLSVAIDPSRLRAEVSVGSGRRWRLSVAMPAAYEALVTDVQFLVYRFGEAPERVVAKRKGRGQYVAELVERGATQLIEARVIASGRKSFTLPVYCTRPREAPHRPHVRGG